MLARVRRNPRADSVRKALDGVTYALSANDIWVNEFLHPESGRPGADYVLGFGKSGEVVGSFDVTPEGETASVRWVARNGLSPAQVGLVEAHARLFVAL